MRKNFSVTTRSNAEGNYQENSVPEEGELVEIKRDFIIEHDELVSYESLIKTTQMTDSPLQHEIVILLEKSMQEEESMAYWYKMNTSLIFDNYGPR
jgi:hypothetical protein